MEFTSWFSGDLLNTINALANMSSSMASSIVNMLFLFVIFLLIFRAFTAYASKKSLKAVGMNVLYVFILGFLFLGSGKYYINYVNITGFTKDDSKNLDKTAPSDSQKIEVGGESPGGVVSLPATKSNDGSYNFLRFSLTNVPNVYAIPAFMDEIAVSLATAAGLARSGDYYTLAVMSDPNIVFTMSANEMLKKYKDVYSLCKFYIVYQKCFNEKKFSKMTDACNDTIANSSAGDENFWSTYSNVSKKDCNDLIQTYGQLMQGYLDVTLKNNLNDSNYKTIYDTYSSMAKRLQQGEFDQLPLSVKQQLKTSLENILEAVYSTAQVVGEGDVASALTDSNRVSRFFQGIGMKMKEIYASIGKSWLVQTLLIQNEIVIFLSFFLLPLIVLVTFLTNNFKYLIEYSLGYLLLKLQLPLWVIGHYLVTGHAFTNLLASPTINGYLTILVSQGEINNSDILVNTITAGVTALGVGSLFLFGKSAAGGVQQGVSAGAGILKGAMEAIGAAVAVGSALFTGGTSLAGGLAAGASGAATTAAGGASAAGGMAGGLAGFGSIGGAVSRIAQPMMGALNRVGYKIGQKLSKKSVREVFHEGGKFSVDAATDAVKNMKFGSSKDVEGFLSQQRKLGREAEMKVNGETGEESMVIKNTDGNKAIYKKQNDGSWHLSNEDGANSFALSERDIIGNRHVGPAQ